MLEFAQTGCVGVRRTDPATRPFRRQGPSSKAGIGSRSRFVAIEARAVDDLRNRQRLHVLRESVFVESLRRKIVGVVVPEALVGRHDRFEVVQVQAHRRHAGSSREWRSMPQRRYDANLTP
ncbi:MAG TPA: hypothetical protein VJ724_14320, partial [Tahibacter sp.]|nr:hypothetical protein [Tahibacter sp.]